VESEKTRGGCGIEKGRKASTPPFNSAVEVIEKRRKRGIVPPGLLTSVGSGLGLSAAQSS